ncbi:MAG: hypothetical protein ACFBSD_07420 [Paracoccaceae bacterium]
MLDIPAIAVAEAVWSAALGYAYAGLAVAAAFLAVGIDRVEPNARGAYAFRPLLIPGLVLLWPLVLWRWWALETGRGGTREALLARHRPPLGAHSRAWRLLGVALPLILIGALVLRQDGPLERPAERLAPPEEPRP